MNLIIKINLDGDVFKPEIGPELKRVLLKFIDRLPDGGLINGKDIFDSNHNKIGFATFRGRTFDPIKKKFHTSEDEYQKWAIYCDGDIDIQIEVVNKNSGDSLCKIFNDLYARIDKIEDRLPVIHPPKRDDGGELF